MHLTGSCTCHSSTRDELHPSHPLRSTPPPSHALRTRISAQQSATIATKAKAVFTERASAAAQSALRPHASDCSAKRHQSAEHVLPAELLEQRACACVPVQAVYIWQHLPPVCPCSCSLRDCTMPLRYVSNSWWPLVAAHSATVTCIDTGTVGNDAEGPAVVGARRCTHKPVIV